MIFAAAYKQLFIVLDCRHAKPWASLGKETTLEGFKSLSYLSLYSLVNIYNYLSYFSRNSKKIQMGLLHPGCRNGKPCRVCGVAPRKPGWKISRRVFDGQKPSKNGKMRTISGWWFGTCFIFPYIENNHPNWRTHIFQRGRSTTNQIWTSKSLPKSLKTEVYPLVI